MLFQPLSGSTGGRGIQLTATADPGNTIHTVNGFSGPDALWLYAVNSDTVDRVVTVEYGGSTSPDDLIPCNVSANGGLTLIVPGLPLTSGVVKAYAAVANKISIFGFFRPREWQLDMADFHQQDALSTGRGVKLTSTSDPGNTIYTAVESLDGREDTIWLYAVNNDSTDHVATVEWGSNSASDLIPCNVPANGGLTMIVPGLPLSPGLVVKAYADAANKVIVFGHHRTALAIRDHLQEVRARFKHEGRFGDWQAAGNL